MSSIYFDITSTTQFDLLTKSSHVCVIDFHAHWCGPCKILSPKLENTVKSDKLLMKKTLLNVPNVTFADVNGKITFIKINVDDFGEIAQIFKIKSIPHIAFYKDGKLQEKVIIGPKCEEIIQYIKELVDSD
jgi:thioredoxin 1